MHILHTLFFFFFWIKSDLEKVKLTALVIVLSVFKLALSSVCREKGIRLSSECL